MKKMMLMAVLTLMTQMALAGRSSVKEIETKVEPWAKAIETAKAADINKGDFANNKELKGKVSNTLDAIASKGGIGNSAGLMKLLNSGSAKEVLVELLRLDSIIKDTEASQREKDIAMKALETLSLIGSKLEVLSASPAEKAAHKEQANKSLKYANQMAIFETMESATSKEYAAEFKRVIKEQNGTLDLDQARLKANEKTGKELSEKDILDCV